MSIALLALVAYHHSFGVPLLFDDLLAITSNSSIWNLRDLGAVLAPPNEAPTAGRPLLSLTFALNYAWGGARVTGYHVANFLLHLVAVPTLFGVVRRTLSSPPAGSRLNAAAGPLAFAVAALWAVHPSHTATVTYISQRAELLMGVCWLLTLYCFTRSAAVSRGSLWGWLSVTACALGMLSKETMVTAPLVVLLYDRTFWAGTFREALQRRGRYYGALALTWLIVASLMIGSRVGARGVGFGTEVNAWTYALTQCRVVLEYAKLTFWPHPLVFDYGPELMAKSITEVWPFALAMLALVGGTGLALWRKQAVGFLPAAFLLALAPTSSVVPVIHQPMAENRMYLPSAAIITLAVVGIYFVLQRRSWPVLPLLAVSLAGLTSRRNTDYGSAVRIWTDTVLKRPHSVRAHNYLADALYARGDREGSIRHSRIALRLAPGNDVAHNNLGLVFLSHPETLPEAVAHLEAAARARPGYAPVLVNLGNALLRLPGRRAEGLARLREAVRVMPEYADGRLSLGGALLSEPGGASEALREFAEAVRLNPKNAKAHVNLSVALAALNRYAEAARHSQIALQLQPDYPEAHLNLGNALLRLPGGQMQAISHFRTAARLRPHFPEAWFNLGVALEPIRGQEREAMAALNEALRLQPNFAGAKELLERIRARMPEQGRPE